MTRRGLSVAAAIIASILALAAETVKVETANAETAKTEPPAVANPAHAAEAAAVLRVFDAMRDAAGRGDGKRLTAGLSQETMARLEAVRQAARRSTGTAAGLSPAERLAAGGLKRATTPADLNRKGLDELASAALRRRADFAKELRGAGLGPVKINGDHAAAALLSDRRPTMFTVDFVREAGAWKLDLRPMVKRGDMFLTGMAALKGVPEDALIDAILGQMESRMRQGG